MGTPTSMLELAQNETRLALATARRLAFVGDEDAAHAHLDMMLLKVAGRPIDRAAILLAKADLLYLAGKYRASYGIFVQELEPLSLDLPHSLSLIIGFNRCDVASALFNPEGAARFYELIDEQRIAGIEHWDDSALLSAARHSAKGHSYESLPLIWRELLRTYRQGRWAAFRQASRQMAEECIRIGLPSEAAFHSSVACDDDCGKQIGVILLNSRNDAAVKATVDKLLTNANLQRHFNVACQLLAVMADVIQDPDVDRVIDWALLRCSNAEEPEDRANSERIAWELVEALATRASRDTAARIVSAALGHRSWNAHPVQPNRFIPVREEIINAVCQCVRVVAPESLIALADEAIPLATERHSSKDFHNAVILLARISFHGSDEVKAKIKAALYSPGKALPPLLLQSARHFQQQIPNNDNQLEKYAGTVADNVSRVVQHVPVDTNSAPVHGSVATFNSVSDGEQTIIHLVTGDEIRAMACNRDQFPAASVQLVVSALLASICDPSNLLDNRLLFIECVREFADCFDRQTARKVFQVLAPIAKGAVKQTPGIPTGAESHPLSRIRINCATAKHVTAHALFALASIEHHLPKVYGKRLEKVVTKALSNEDPEIRKSAFAAVREIPTLVESTWMPVLLGTRDPDPNAASLAFDAIATKQNARLTRAQWRLVLYSLRMAQRSASIELRRSAAKAASTLLPQAQRNSTCDELQMIRQQFANDISFVVRQASISEPDVR